MPDYDYFELIAALSHDFGRAAISVEAAWSPDYFLESGDAFAVTGGLTVPITDTFLFFNGGLSASAHVGHQWVDGPGDYLFFDIGATARWEIFDVDVRWIDTDIDDVDCSQVDTCEGGVVVSVTANLPG